MAVAGGKRRTSPDGPKGLGGLAEHVIGYDKASVIAHRADNNDLTLREAALKPEFINAKQFDEIVVPRNMTGHGLDGA
jgi:fumarate hydratase class II